MSNELKKVPKILRKKLKKQTFLNLNHIQVSSNEKLVELDKICNNIAGTKFIIIYMKDNIIVGENIISISYPIYKHYLDVNLDARINAERSINKLAKQMKLLKANSYYIIHISNIENNSILKQNIDTTSFFANNLKGIRGHLIINANSYYWIDVKDNNIVVSKKKYIKPSINMMKNKMNILKLKLRSIMENKEKFLKILYKQVGELPKVMKIENTLEAKQEVVGGLIEVIPYKDALIICNEEAKTLNMKPNLIFDYDYIAGDCFAVGDDYKNAGFKSLTEEQIKEFTIDFIKRSLKEKRTLRRNKTYKTFKGKSR